ncbi:unnamed protein product [Dovyalis caffra]|uniref:Uncharacterized protein n=1 Tax=Dovyalis caffra TaxID=77055 RepID=A0AAV1QTG3_9ROSI|nr:unnamed protein product [Dovyalis caffra]
MGVIQEGKVSGLIPSNEGLAVHYPGYPSSTSGAIQTLGGTESILNARMLFEKYLKRRSPINDAKQETDEFHVDIVARIPEAYYFEGMADYRYVVPFMLT